MSPLLIAFVGAAMLLTVAPGLDTAFVVRTAAIEGGRRAFFGGLGVAAGCLVWAAAVAIGVGAIIAASQLAYTVLKWIGAAYLCWLGIKLIISARGSFEIEASAARDHPFVRGFLTNILNPKVGVFYISFLPQFVPADAVVGPYLMFLALIHASMGVLWFLLLISMTSPIMKFLKRSSVLKTIDRVTGGVFLSFGVALALESRR